MDYDALVNKYANSRNGLVVAPAGCGKTELLARSVACSTPRQLVLTHTNAGVRAIRLRLLKLKVAAALFRVTTIDGFVQKFVHSYPMSSKLPAMSTYMNSDWRQVRESFLNLAELNSIKAVIRNSYSGVYVDEYQDCSVEQHHIILKLAHLLPVRIVGDPLQAIYARFESMSMCTWSEVTSKFDTLHEMGTPHRWKGKNLDLGYWLGHVRKSLKEGTEIDLSNPFVTWLPDEPDIRQAQRRACLTSLRNTGSSAVICDLRNQCYYHARYLKGLYHAMEPVNFDDFEEIAGEIGRATGIRRLELFSTVARMCLANLPDAFERIVTNVLAGKGYRTNRTENQQLFSVCCRIADGSIEAFLEGLTYLMKLVPKPTVVRHEMWFSIIKLLQECLVHPATPIQSIARRMRERVRYSGGGNHPRVLSTPLLVKGLEYDHGVILDAEHHNDAESLYVALTRASRSLTVISRTRRIVREKPLYLR